MSKKRLGLIIFLWDSAWKAAAVAVAIRNRQYRWVGPLIVANTVGVLPMVYLFRFAKSPNDDEQEGELSWS
ncbi:MAG: DUF5652 family protein [Dehalococcoidia bacterium]|nr:DUF5652 family protein [Dehalococcoidia bacterium]